MLWNYKLYKTRLVLDLNEDTLIKYSLCQLLENRNTCHRPTIVIFLDLKANFDSVGRVVLWHCLSWKKPSLKVDKPHNSLDSNTTSRVKTFGILSLELSTSSGVRQGYPLSLFLSNFVRCSLEVSISPFSSSGIGFLSGNLPLFGVEYANDIVLFGLISEVSSALLGRYLTKFQHGFKKTRLDFYKLTSNVL